jgi:hypothetical protein
LGLVVLTLWACAKQGPPPIAISQDALHGVWITFDPESGPGYDHPARIELERMQAILEGLWAKHRDVVGGFGLFAGEGMRAFDQPDARFLAPILRHALEKASPKDLITFYLAGRGGANGSPITSGGLFVRNGRMHVILANCQTSPYAIQYENTYSFDAREDPLLPIASKKFTIGFSPDTAVIPNKQLRGTAEFRGYLDESKLVILELAKVPVSSLKPATSTP